MLESVVNLGIGGGGMAVYIYLWNRVAPRNRQHVDTPTGKLDRRRARIWNLVFFLLLTPYVLLLFALMKKAEEGLGL
ncbi:MAG: hypothetical protein GKR89_13320 [Candidatus Latescibacteria bacterium]|nr:hypothetical protein [Candidatus Latescibacterota bacterium]